MRISKTSRLFPVAMILLFQVVNLSEQKRNGKRGHGKQLETKHKFTPEQLHLLEKIKIAGEEGGLPSSELRRILKFDKDVCYEEGCLKSALEIMSATNFNVDSCEQRNWLEFVCQRRLATQDHQGQQFSLLEKFGEQTQELLLLTSTEAANATDTDSSSDPEENEHEEAFLLHEARVFCYQCLFKGVHVDKEIKYILSYTKKYGGWPMITHQDPPNDFAWLRMVADQNRLQFHQHLQLLEVMVDEGEPLIHLGIGQTSLPYYTDAIKDYEIAMARMHKEGKLDSFVNTTQIRSTMKYMSEFTTKVVSLLPENLDNMTISNLTLLQLEAATRKYFEENKVPGRVNWIEFFSRVLDGTGINFNSTHPLISLPLEPVLEMAAWVEQEMQSNETEGRLAIVNALYLNVVVALLQETTWITEDLATFRCDVKSGSRKANCVERTTETFGYSLRKTALDAHYNDSELTPKIHDLMDNLKKGHLKWVSGTSWSDEVKALVSDKIQSIKLTVAQPDWVKEPGKLAEFYKDLKASSDPESTYAKNFISINTWQVAKKREWAHRTSVVRNSSKLEIYDADWSNYLWTGDMLYGHNNEIFVDASNIDEPLFSPDYPGFMNYGGIGALMSHEVAHSFIGQGRTHDKYGNEGEFWDERSVAMYTELVNGIIQHYERTDYYISGKKMGWSGLRENTTEEDVADVVGVAGAFFAYQEYLKGLERVGKKEKVLPGLRTFSPQKLFFMKYANMWCTKLDEQSLFDTWHSDDHSPDNRRASLPLWRLEEFKTAFSCSS